MKKTRVVAAVLAVFAGLLLLQVLTYVFLAERAMPRTLLRFLDRDRDYDFVCIDDRTWEALSLRHREALDEALSDRYGVVLHSRDDIPEARWVRDPSFGSEPLGVKGGCIVNWEMSNRGLFWFTGGCSSWVSMEGAEGRSVTFVWILFTWVKVRTHYVVMA